MINTVPAPASPLFLQTWYPDPPADPHQPLYEAPGGGYIGFLFLLFVAGEIAFLIVLDIDLYAKTCSLLRQNVCAKRYGLATRGRSKKRRNNKTGTKGRKKKRRRKTDGGVDNVDIGQSEEGAINMEDSSDLRELT